MATAAVAVVAESVTMNRGAETFVLVHGQGGSMPTEDEIKAIQLMQKNGPMLWDRVFPAGFQPTRKVGKKTGKPHLSIVLPRVDGNRKPTPKKDPHCCVENPKLHF